MSGEDDKRHELYFIAALAVLCAVFFSLQLSYVRTLPLVMDEYVSAYHSIEIFRRTPYGEFAPYKNVLGYAVNGAFLKMGGDHWSGLMIARTFLVVLNTGMILLGGFLLRRHARRVPILIAIALLVVMSTFLERSAELRVDMEAAWAGMVSLLLLLRHKWIAAGAVAAASFLISQKGAYFVVAADVGLVFYWGFALDKRDRLRPLLLFCAAALGALLAYMLLWWIISGSLGNVIDAMFLSHRRVLLENPYGEIRQRFWTQTFWRNPMYYVALLAALWRLDVLRRAHRDDDVLRILVPYAAVVIGLCLLHSKPWPYFIPMICPTALVVHAIYFDRASKQTPRVLTPAIAVLLVVLGIVWPLRRVDNVMERDLGRQKATVMFAEEMLSHGGTYVGGVPYLYRHDQVIDKFESLDKGRIRALRKEGGQAHNNYVRTMKERQLAFVIHSYRVRGFPGPIQGFFKGYYQRLWGPVLVYAPKLVTQATTLDIWVSGRYRLAGKAIVTIDGKRVEPADFVHLEAGKHQLSAPSGGRLAYYPEGIEPFMDRKYDKLKALFPNIYEY